MCLYKAKVSQFCQMTYHFYHPFWDVQLDV